MTAINLSEGEIILLRAGKASAIVVSNDIYLTVVGVGTGIMLAVSCKVIQHSIERCITLRSPDSVILKDTRKYRRILRGLRDQFGNRIIINLNKSLSGREILSLFRHLMGNRELNQSLRFLGSNLTKVIRLIIRLRFSIMVIRALAYYLRTKENLFILTFNTLRLFAYSSNRSIEVSCAFFIIVSLIAKIWWSVPALRPVLHFWVMVTSLNLSDQLQFVDPDFAISQFGIPRIEHVRPQLNYSLLSEHVLPSKISMIGKEDKLNLSLPLLTESTKVISPNLELEINKIIQTSTLVEEQILLPKQLEEEKVNSGTHPIKKFATVKPTVKKKTNNLRNLKQTFDFTSPSTIESEAESFYDIKDFKQIKTEKVK